MVCRRRTTGRRWRLGRRPPDHARSTTFDNTSFHALNCPTADTVRGVTRPADRRVRGSSGPEDAGSSGDLRKHDGVVHQTTVDRRGRGHLVTEDPAPLAEDQIAGHHHRAASYRSASSVNNASAFVRTLLYAARSSSRMTSKRSSLRRARDRFTPPQ